MVGAKTLVAAVLASLAAAEPQELVTAPKSTPGCTTYSTVFRAAAAPTTLVYSATRTAWYGVDCGGCRTLSTRVLMPTATPAAVAPAKDPVIVTMKGTTTVSRASCKPSSTTKKPAPTDGVPTNLCAAVTCLTGSQCVETDGVAKCVPNSSGGSGGGEQCGTAVCGAGYYCCNRSCGICAPKDGACIQLFCG